VTVPPQHGSIEVNGLQVTYIPDPDYSGTDEFSYQVSDGTSTSGETGVVSLTVDAVRDAPMIEVEAAQSASQGFLLRHAFAVHDPDPDETVSFTVNWGDGTTSGEGHFELNGNPIPANEVFNPDGTLRQGVTVTGPVLELGANGRAGIAANHAYATAGTFQVNTCVFDQATIDPVTQEKSPTAASLSSCAQTDITVNLEAAVSMDIDAPPDSLPKGANANFTVTIRNAPFDIPAADPRFASLPDAGPDIVNLVLAGEFVPGLDLLSVNSTDASCVTTGAEFSCSVPVLPYSTGVTLSLSSKVADIAPGHSVLGVVVEADWLDARETPLAAGFVTIQSSGA
ncbi:MAG: Ig-like domain-containing protein, partial [Woeseiaceae bacterium]